jgi:Fe-S cluster assembly ATP-binding protein
MELLLKDLHIDIEGKQIVKGVDLRVPQGEVHALMGPNGSGKSSLAQTIMGHPKFKVVQGDILLDGSSILDKTADQRARSGLFLAFQYPYEISGVTVSNFLRSAYLSQKSGGKPANIDQQAESYFEFREMLKEKLRVLKMDESFAERYLNEGFSGGEKKRCEILQLAVLKPKIALLDETDSGLDIDALKIVAGGINALTGPDMGVLLITHYQRILRYVRPQHVHVMVQGKIVKSGGAELADQLEEKGYDWITKAA